MPGELDCYMQKNGMRPTTYTIHQNKLKVDKRLKYKSWHHKVLQENIWRKISKISHSNIFTDISPRARDIKERINKWDFIKIKSFCMAKENISKMKRKPTVWQNIFANDTWDKSLISKMYKELIWLNTRKTIIQLKNRQTTWTDTSPRRTYRGPIGIWKDAQHH